MVVFVKTDPRNLTKADKNESLKGIECQERKFNVLINVLWPIFNSFYCLIIIINFLLIESIFSSHIAANEINNKKHI